jgi:uncharacterized protein
MAFDPRRVAKRRLTCPTCGKLFSPEETQVMPFCSPRCRQIDLGRWFNEEIGLPVEPGDEGEEVDEGFSNREFS